MRIKKFLSIKFILSLLLLGLLQMQCKCKRLVKDIGYNTDEIEETKRQQQALANKGVAGIEARSAAFSKWMAEMARLDAIAAEKEAEATKKRLERLRQIAASIKERAPEPREYLFVPSIRIHNVGRLRGYIQLFKYLLTKEGASGFLTEKLKQKAQQIASSILGEQSELEVIYNNLQNRLNKPVSEDPKSIQRDQDDSQLARELLEEIEVAKAEFRAVLVANNEDLANYETHFFKQKSK